ncbi:MAG: acetate--CoA ligase family protein [Burkholderiales bacterium]|nr:acetate--CoA ligase family protein [Burkholderiales bacterium]
MRPRSVAIIGASARPGSSGQNILQGLKLNRFQGPIYLVGRSAQPIDGLPVLPSPEDLPEGVELAVLTLPAAGVRDAIAACVKRKVGAALVFAAGFAEAGARDVQEEVTRIAREGDLAICGPNCIGFTNNVDGLTLHMLFSREARRSQPGDKPGLALVGQSGGLLGHLQRAVEARELPLSYVISTGNEAGLDLADYTDVLVEDAATRVILLYGEQIRRPAAFLAAARRARAAGKPVLLLHPGRSARARAAAQSHTGAMVGNHGAMLVSVADAGVLAVETMDELTDVAELLTRYPEPPAKGPAVFTASGAYVALINDFSEQLDLEFPALTDATMETLKATLPHFGTAGNPLDSTAGAAPGANPILIRALVADPNVGSLFVSYPISQTKQVEEIIQGLEGNAKPVSVVALGDSSTLPADLMDVANSGPFVFGRSSDRALRAIARYTGYGKLLARPRNDAPPQPFPALPPLGQGTQPEWVGKKLLAAAGIRVPEGALARTEEEACVIAARIGFPVAVKAQAAALSHKTEAGGVILGVANEPALREAWLTLQNNVARAQPGLVLDGALVESMSPRGLELMVGAKRDPGWGPVLLLGLGGIWVEALGDVRLLSPGLPQALIVEELLKLRSARLLTSFRGAPPVDVEAVARAAALIGRLMLTVPAIAEIDVNPLMAYAKGQGATALDALVVTG